MIDRSPVNRLRSLFDDAPDGILLSDDAGRCVDANPALCAWLRYQRIEMVGMPICDLMVPVPAPGRTGRRIGAGRPQTLKGTQHGMRKAHETEDIGQLGPVNRC